MSDIPNPNLSSLSPRDECLARIALANTPADRLRLGLSAVVGNADGTVAVLTPDPGAGEKPQASGEPLSQPGSEAPDRRG